ncbi:MAG TPA: carbonic anhydrase [Phycisphaerae bacterium]|nr:carbonic anhydrase [Phycisphaerae bacterium]
MRQVYRCAVGVMLVCLSFGCSTATHSDGSATATRPLDVLMAGNQRFVSGHPMNVQNTSEREQLAAGQHPIAIIVGCSDSRVPPEVVFDQGLGQLFVVRVAGEVVDDHALGSIEYAAEHLHSHLIVVLGHDKCGAVQAAVAGGEAPGHIRSIVEAIQPAVEEAKKEPGDDLLDKAIDANVLNVTDRIKHSQPILAHMVETGEVQVVAARYKLATGEVQLLGAANP